MERKALPRVEREKVGFDSADGVSRIHGYVWRGMGEEPRAVVQLIHGMAEYVGRYDEFARHLARRGYVVCGHDQVGHGASSPATKWGVLPSHGGRDVLVEDVHRLRRLVSSQLERPLPHFVFGHSMGSFVARAYVSQHADGLAGAIICGTGFVPPATSAAGHVLAILIACLRGDSHKSELLHSMADGAYARAIPHARTEFDWLSHNQRNVDEYIADKSCGFLFSAGGYATLTELTSEVCSPTCVRRVPASLPLLFVAGAEDPVGDFGRGVTRSAELARDAGSTDVTYHLYANMRHEILKEDGCQLVFDDVTRWLDGHLGGEK